MNNKFNIFTGTEAEMINMWRGECYGVAQKTRRDYTQRYYYYATRDHNVYVWVRSRRLTDRVATALGLYSFNVWEVTGYPRPDPKIHVKRPPSAGDQA